ncbi:MAG: 50S ribosomal protein L4 [Collinsella bouchesdurhonensis]|jgi:large subunit ribosomal protein L4|uniref:50S ribosomal protein L4 n=1 Tax=Collinsella bouchesdurhonensis TaxID=1907654 RepID=UPI001105E79F|nr:50S ribosomal protein L4 [Collinsella bouchesdurhonensis]MEE0279415.1 50S ribosomal protein L4 [Collinsella bouchesdurhonensis]
MSKFEVMNSEGKKATEAELAPEVYGIEPNIHVMHHIVKCQQACWRQGTQSAKGRSEVSGGGRKPWRQKGTGRARQGSTRAPQWRHGGVVFAPKPRSYAKRMNAKEVKLAMRSALSAKVRDNELVLVDDYAFEKPSTKAAVAMLKALGLEGKRLTIIVRDEDINAYLSFRNVPKTFIITPDEANTYDLLNNGALLMTADIAAHFGEVLA